jgi:hypothetical protein
MNYPLGPNKHAWGYPMQQLRSLVAAPVFAVFGASSAWGALITGPTSPYYLDGGLTEVIYVVQGTAVINAFDWNLLACPGCEGTLAVTNVVSTTRYSNSSGTGEQYELDGTPTGTTWPTTPPLAGETSNRFYDGTSDGTQNYTVEYDSSPLGGEQKIIVTDANWQNPALLFTIPGSAPKDSVGVAYDSTTNSLWISGFFTDVIANYMLDGTPLSSFNTGITGMFALAFDPADGTLWFSQGGTNALYQFSTSGTLLQSGIPSGLPNANFLSGEFAVTSSVPVPAALPLFTSGLGLLGWLGKRKRKAQPA